MKKNRVAVVIPTHRGSFTDYEKTSLRHLKHFLPNLHVYFVVPKRVKRVEAKNINFEVIHMPDSHFVNVASYCAMVNSLSFYTPFADYDYMLLHQLDVILLSSNIEKFLDKYDYIGPPFFRPVIGYLSCPKGIPVSGGNGGFSLRKISTFIDVIEKAEKETTRETKDTRVSKIWFLRALLTGQTYGKWLKAPPYSYPFNEDGFWSYEAPKYLKSYTVAPFKEALRFGFERFPRKCFDLNKHKLPFGVHAWQKYDKAFWTKHILR